MSEVLVSDHISAKPAKLDKRKTRRVLIRDLALGLFAERGYDRTSLQDIADGLGLTHPAIYYYYKSKSELLFDAIRVTLQDMQNELDASVNDEKLSADNRLRSLIETQVQIQFTNQETIRLIDSVLFGAMSRANIFTKEQASDLLELQRRIVDLYKALLAEGIKAGVFQMEDKTVTTFAILGAISNVPYWFRRGGELSRKDVAARMANYLLKSLR